MAGRLMEQIMEYNILDYSKWNDDKAFGQVFNKIILVWICFISLMQSAKIITFVVNPKTLFADRIIQKSQKDFFTESYHGKDTQSYMKYNSPLFGVPSTAPLRIEKTPLPASPENS